MAYVYRFIGDNNEIIYVGYTGQQLETRIRQHFEKGHLSEECYKAICRIEYRSYKTKADAQVYEVFYINKFKPIYNKLNKQTDSLTIDLEDKEAKWKIHKVIRDPKLRTPVKVKWLELISFGTLGYIIYKILEFLL